MAAVKMSRTCPLWCSKYFWEGQALDKRQTIALAHLGPDTSWYKRLVVRHRRLLGLLLPAAFFHMAWLALAVRYNLWQLFPDRYFISITMIFGSMIAGMTSEGGGAVAFPVMTLAFKIAPSVARDFSLMIQSCGMTAAAFTIFFMRVQLEWYSVIFCSAGGAIGMVIGLEFIDPILSAPQKKMGFVCVWFSFAFALFMLNRYHKRKTFSKIPNFKIWKSGALLLTGFFGGVFSAIAGSGLDICSFSILTLLFRVTEKVATPTSVILMAGNTMVGFFWRQLMMTTVSQDAWDYLAVCVPIVVIGAPLGSVLSSHFHRLVLASLVYFLDAAALISAFIIVPLSPALIGLSVGIIVFGFVFFFLITLAGQKLLKDMNEDVNPDKIDNVIEDDNHVNDLDDANTNENESPSDLHDHEAATKDNCIISEGATLIQNTTSSTRV